jgi:hypothetical protein
MPRRFWSVPLLALGLVLLLTMAWTIKEWAALRHLRLPDNDDMMRLAEIRDWIGGQAFNDLMQHRLGPPGGASMHWSRLADAVPAAMILALAPLVGTHGAEVAMVIAWPALLFFCYLLLAARIAGQLHGTGARPIAVILAALAFPTISLFIPGRIDHHALQIVLMLALVDGLLRTPSRATGAVMGLVVAASLAIGLESAPELVAVMAALGWLWLTGDAREDGRALGFGIALAGATGLMLAFMHPYVWPREWCDGFTPASTSATLALAAGWSVLGLAGPRLRGVGPRLAVAALVGCVVAWSVSRTSMVCLAGPYDALTPFLKRVWMSNVSEARGLFVGQDTLGTIIAYGTLSLIGSALAVVQAIRGGWRARGAVAFAIVLAISAVAAILQIRVTYILAGLAAIPFAIAIAATRGAPDQMPRRLLLWLLGAGVTYLAISKQMDAVLAQPVMVVRENVGRCTTADQFVAIARQPRGLVVAPIDLGSYLIGMTPHRVWAAGYHRNNRGNMAAYRFFLAPPDRAATFARRSGVDYVALCPDIMHESELAPYRPGSLVEALQAGRVPAWLEPIPLPGSMLFFKVRGRLPEGPSPL